jgi:hypothetical protein
MGATAAFGAKPDKIAKLVRAAERQMAQGIFA